ncbi:hypothetical protein EYC84_009875 [Monilinia fructicola]|uniref:Alpha/beta hydrolase fold-3 domain-containing protein n=1 Tax=Monilinia fructicola TaxID=38448 RepID=A0A5M9JI25_MONFR|nr:hypothetical protein EYC84_009875 [Monilinia fructicola]
MDTSSPLSFVKVVLPKVPMIGKTVLFHTLGLSSNSTHWDLKTELTVNMLRSFTHSTQNSISQTQAATLRDPGIKGKLWISKVTLPTPAEDDIRQKLFHAIEDMKPDGAPEHAFEEPDLMPVEAEWTGHRAGATKDSKRLHIPEPQQYTEMMKEVNTPTTILYLHGGAHWLLDPATYRNPLSKLAHLTGGRVLSLRYRLAPQNPFPAALLDCLVAYLNLLFPPPDALHTAVPPNHIILSGDSAGGNLALSLSLFLLHLHKTHTPITWNGTPHLVPLPAGLALSSPWNDLLCSSPSHSLNLKTDYLPSPALSPGTSHRPFPPCTLWPPRSPRPNIYCETTLLTHPLVSPLSAPAHSWLGIPPLLIQIGTELLSDENKILAAKIARIGGVVRWEEYEMMPHCFALVLPHLEGADRCFESWAGFCREVVGVEGLEDEGEGKPGIKTSGKTISAKSLNETEVDVAGLWEESDEEVLERMRERVRILEGDLGGE